MTRPLSLAHLTFIDLPPPEFIRLAAQAGFSSVGLRLIAVTDTTPGYDLMTDQQMMRDTLHALRETGVTVNDIEFVRLTPGFDPKGLDPFLAAGAELDAKYIVTAPYDPDLLRMTENLSGFADRAANYNLAPVLEFFPWTHVPDVRTAFDIVENTGNSSVGVLLDTLHFDRSKSTLDDLDAIDTSRMPFLHLCDANVYPTYSETMLLHAARAARLIPGEGDIALTSILSRLPDDIPIALEIPMEDQRGLDPLDLAGDIFRQTQAFLAKGTENGGLLH